MSFELSFIRLLLFILCQPSGIYTHDVLPSCLHLHPFGCVVSRRMWWLTRHPTQTKRERKDGRPPFPLQTYHVNGEKSWNFVFYFFEFLFIYSCDAVGKRRRSRYHIVDILLLCLWEKIQRRVKKKNQNCRIIVSSSDEYEIASSTRRK